MEKFMSMLLRIGEKHHCLFKWIAMHVPESGKTTKSEDMHDHEGHAWIKISEKTVSKNAGYETPNLVVEPYSTADFQIFSI